VRNTRWQLWATRRGTPRGSEKRRRKDLYLVEVQGRATQSKMSKEKRERGTTVVKLSTR
jgi:hypothetical protein